MTFVQRVERAASRVVVIPGAIQVLGPIRKVYIVTITGAIRNIAFKTFNAE